MGVFGVCAIPITSRYDGDVRWVPVGCAGRDLKVSRQRIYQLIESGALVSCKLDGTVLVSQRSIEARAALLDQEGERCDVGR